MARNKYIKCLICLKNIRSDHMKTHKHEESDKKKYPMKTCVVCEKTMIGKNLPRHMKIHNKKSKEMSKDILQYQEQYDKDKRDDEIVKGLI